MLSNFCQRFVNVLSTFYFFEHPISLRILSFTTDNSLCSNKKTLPYSERALEVPIGFEPMKNGFAVLIDALFLLSKDPRCFNLIDI